MSGASDFFDRVVVINLDRRPDRLEAFYRRLELAPWPFKWPERFAAIDGQTIDPPDWWTKGRGPWACRLSHLEVTRSALRDGVQRLLILEDDVWFPPRWQLLKHIAEVAPEGLTYAEMVKMFGDEIFSSDFQELGPLFVKNLPSDWAFASFGGRMSGGFALPVAPWVSKLVIASPNKRVQVSFTDAITGKKITAYAPQSMELFKYGWIGAFHCYGQSRDTMEFHVELQESERCDNECDGLITGRLIEAGKSVYIATPELCTQTYDESDNRVYGTRAQRFVPRALDPDPIWNFNPPLRVTANSKGPRFVGISTRQETQD